MIRHPKMKNGRLCAYWIEKEHDLFFNWGDGCSKADAHLLEGNGYFLKLAMELKKRGYNLETLRFTIDKATDKLQTGGIDGSQVNSTDHS